jgi:hypothetical protein
MSSSGTESDSTASSDVNFDDHGEFGYQLEPEYTEEELRQMEEAASSQHREIENNPSQNDTNWCSCSKCISLHMYLCPRNACAGVGQSKYTEIRPHHISSCSSDFVLKTWERASDLKMLISFPFFVCHF